MVSWGPGRCVNRAIGASLDALGDDDLDRLEAFYDDAGVPPSIEVLSWAGPTLVAQLVARRFAPIRFVDLLVIDASRARQMRSRRSPSARSMTSSRRRVERRVRRGIRDDAGGRARSTVSSPASSPTYRSSVHLIADIDGVAAGCGSLYPQGRVGWVGGGATFAGRFGGAAFRPRCSAEAARRSASVPACRWLPPRPGRQSDPRNMQRLASPRATNHVTTTAEEPHSLHLARPFVGCRCYASAVRELRRQTSSMRAMSARSPWRVPSLRMRV